MGPLLARIAPMLATLAVLVVAISVLMPGFLDVSIANGRLYGSPVDVLNRGAPAAPAPEHDDVSLCIYTNRNIVVEEL